MKKRIISLLLCLVLIVSLMPAAAAANMSNSKTVTVRFHAHGRAETKFADVAALRDAVMRDIAAAAAYFEREGIE